MIEREKVRMHKELGSTVEREKEKSSKLIFFVKGPNFKRRVGEDITGYISTFLINLIHE